jgi:citrate synthase
MLPYRVYKNFNPRAKIIWEVAEEVFQISSIDVAVELEKICKDMGFL